MLPNYLTDSLSTDEIKLLPSYECIISYLLEMRETFPILHLDALQTFVTSASSTSGGLCFCLLKHMVSLCSRVMKNDIINAFANIGIEIA